MDGLHPKIVELIKHAIAHTDIDFTVLEGLRSLERQHQLVKSGASTTLNSRHLTGHAIDIAPYVNGEVSWAWPHYYKLKDYIFWASDELNIDIKWGGDWETFKDGPHWELCWTKHPRDEKFVPWRVG
jgi:peptidoglycan L-alanyl-D-glutamate endopeptidase CwlK